MKYAISTLMALLLVGCGSGGTTYSTGGYAEPGVPADGDAIIVTANGGGGAGSETSSTLVYTHLEDGSVLVSCGDGNGYECAVYVGNDVEPGANQGGAGATGGCGGGADCNK